MSKNIAITFYKSPVGELILGSMDDKLCLADWRYRKMRKTIDGRIQRFTGAAYREESSPVIEDTLKQFAEYFSGERTAFDLPLLLAGTEFQINVWNELVKVEYGTTSTYLELARRLGRESAVRAVAGANGDNAISIIIPCHRIIGSDGELVGYAGGLSVKQRLLELEHTRGLQNELFS